jgi:rare lipoprotein A
MIARAIMVLASWYGPGFHGHAMANGWRYDQEALTVASPDLPLGTCLWLFNPSGKRDSIALVTDRGPYVEGRGLDGSHAVARALGYEAKGLAELVAYRLPRATCGGIRARMVRL